MRRETGVLHDDGDWPGVFVRGDEALGYATMLYAIASRLGDDDVRKPYLSEIADLFASCRVDARTEKPKD